MGKKTIYRMTLYMSPNLSGIGCVLEYKGSMLSGWVAVFGFALDAVAGAVLILSARVRVGSCYLSLSARCSLIISSVVHCGCEQQQVHGGEDLGECNGGRLVAPKEDRFLLGCRRLCWWTRIGLLGRACIAASSRMLSRISLSFHTGCFIPSFACARGKPRYWLKSYRKPRNLL